MIAGDIVAPGDVDFGQGFIADCDLPAAHIALMQDHPGGQGDGVGDDKGIVAGGNFSGVADLAAHFGVESGLVEDEAALFTLEDGVDVRVVL